MPRMGEVIAQLSTLDPTGGVPTVGLLDMATTGRVLFVDSNNGSATNSGLTVDAPVNTLARALVLAGSNTHDVICLAPNHAETISAGMSITTEGVEIVGFGVGDNRPQITFDTATTAAIDFDADNIKIRNVIFKNDIDSQENMLSLNKAYGVVEDCEFYEGSSKQALIAIEVSSTDSNYCRIARNKFVSATSGAAYCIKISAACNALDIVGNWIHGDYSTAAIGNPTGNIATLLNISGNYISNINSGDWAIELVSACTGSILDNRLYADAAATTLDPGSCFCLGNKAVNAIDTGAVDIPFTGSAEDFIGADNADNNAATTNVVGNADGSLLERIEFVQAELAAHLAAGSGTALATNKSLCDVAGTNGTTVTDSAVSVLGAIGADNANNAFASTSVVANADGSVLERMEWVQTELGAHVADGSGTALATNKSLVDCLGTNGTTVTDSAVSVLGAIGADNNNNAFASTSVVSNADGSVLERLEHSITKSGTTFVVTKTIASNTIVAAGVDLTGVSSGGALLIEDVILQVATAWSSGGAAVGELYTDNAAGAASFMTVAQAKLPTNGACDFKNATTATKLVLELGKKISIKATSTDVTAGGNTTVYIILRRLADGATIAAA